MKFKSLPEKDRETIIAWRISMLKAYHLIASSLNDADAYLSWVRGWIPDEPTESDFESCARDYKCFEEQTQIFKSLMTRYGNEGFLSPTVHDYFSDFVADEEPEDYWQRRLKEIKGESR